MSKQKSIEEIVADVMTIYDRTMAPNRQDVEAEIRRTIKSERDRAEEEKREARINLRKRIGDYSNKKFLEGDLIDPVELYYALTNPQDKQ